MALVTIGIPVYNEEKHLEETIKSALAQQFTDIAVIISDNGSNDASAEIIKKYCKADGRVTGIFHEKNQGPTANFHSLLQNAHSKYFVMLGAHDLFLPEYVGNAVSFLEANLDYVMCYPQSKLVDGNDEALGYCDSDIGSRGLSVRQRMKKTAANLSWCTCFHGVFRTEIVRKLPTLQIRGSDNLFLFAAAYHGPIHFLDQLGILRRESRQETADMIEKRRRDAGNYRDLACRFFDSMSVMAMEHVLFVLEKTELSRFKKISIALEVAFVFRRRLDISLPSMVCAFWYRKKVHSPCLPK